MIKLENLDIVGLESAIRGMRNPKNSWLQSDSGYGCDGTKCIDCTYNNNWCGRTPKYLIGKKDLDLMKRLAKGGSVHAKYRRMIVVYVDLTMPTYVWAEFDTYKIGTVRNSCSFMHKGTAKPFEIVDFSFDEDEIKTIFAELAEDSHEGDAFFEHYVKAWNRVIEELNELRGLYLKTKDDRVFQLIRRLLPSGYNLRATVMLNYENLSAMYHDRKNHRLDEWRAFCKWIEELPYSELITMRKEKNDE